MLHVATKAKEQLDTDIEIIAVNTAEIPEKNLLTWTSKAPEPQVMTHFQFMTGTVAQNGQRMNEMIDEWGLRGPYMNDCCDWVLRFISRYDDKYKWSHQPGPEELQIGMGVGADQLVYWFRKDWFSDPDERAAFKAKYGYELADPEGYPIVIESMSELCDIAQFFTRPDEGIYGFSWPNVTFGIGENYFAPSRGAVHADPETGVPRVNSKEWKDTIYMQRYLFNYTIGAPTDWLEAATLFQEGKVAVTYSFQFHAPGIHGADSKVGMPKDGKVGYCHPPAWVKPRGPAHPLPQGISSWEVPRGTGPGTTDHRYFVGGWNLNLNANAPEEEKRAAFNFVQWYTSPGIGKIVSRDVGHFTPRWSVYLDKEVAERWGCTPILAAAWGNPAVPGSELCWSPARAPEIQVWFGKAVADLQAMVSGELDVEEGSDRVYQYMVDIWKDAGLPTN
jgi:ABC-type glycerol-3-phosphate transport system substrate-binding protein